MQAVSYFRTVCLIFTAFLIEATLAIHGFAICGFDYSHPILMEPNLLLME